MPSTKPFFLVAAFVLMGCETHRAEFDAVEAYLDARLAEKMEIAQNLNARRAELDFLERQIASARARLPPGLDAGQPPFVPAPVAAPPPPEPPMPLPNALEGADAARRRARIADQRARIAQLDLVIGEVQNINARRRELERTLNHLETLHPR